MENAWRSSRFCHFFVVFLFVSIVVSATAVADTSILVIRDGIDDWKALRRVVENLGGRVDMVVLPDVMVGEFPDSVMEALLDPNFVLPGEMKQDLGTLTIIRTRDEARRILTQASDWQKGTSGLSTTVHAALSFLCSPTWPGSYAGGMYRTGENGLIKILPPEQWEEPALLPRDAIDPKYRAESRGIGNDFWHTGEFAAGDVAVGICRPESNGTDGSNVENWTNTEVSFSLAELMKALQRVIQRDVPRGKMTFAIVTEHVGSGVSGTVDSDFEAINYANFTLPVVMHLMGKLGFSGVDAWTRMHEWANRLRTNQGADWGLGFFIVDDSVTGGGRASAYLNGPTVWIFGNDSYKVYHHEMGHSWGAWDEYASAGDSPTLLGGYTQDVNANSQFNDGTGFFAGAGESILALMSDNINYLSPFTHGAWGGWDIDGDGRYEPQDTFPTASLNPPTGSGPLTFTGSAKVTALKNETGSFANNDVSINKIQNVEWRINGSPWQDAQPADGAYDSSSEAFFFTTPPLRNGGVVTEVRATDNFGNTSKLYDRDDSIISGSPLVNTPPMITFTIFPPRGSAGATNFIMDATGTIDPEESVSTLQYRWDFDGDGMFDTPWNMNPLTMYIYPLPNTYIVTCEVMDRQGKTSQRSQTLVVAGADIAPTATFTVDKGLSFLRPMGGIPNVFNFDASGVWDGEDPSAGLLLRWDFDDDGNWEIPWSPMKMVGWDYSITNPVDAQSEMLTTYFYSGNSVNGYAQSFLTGSATTLLGKAELIITHLNDLTPGGTVTVGIATSLTPLTMITGTSISQNAIDDGDWNMFDFPDVAVTPVTVYYLVMLLSDTDIMWAGDTANPYVSGQHYYSFDGGTNWLIVALSDHCFHVYDGNFIPTPLQKSQSWRVRMEVMDSFGNSAQAVHHVTANGYDNPPNQATMTLVSLPPVGPPASPFTLNAVASDPDFGVLWDGMLDYRFDADGDGNFESEFTNAAAYPTSPARSGIYLAECEVRDRYHATAKQVTTITVTNFLTSITLTDRTDGSSLVTDELEIDVAFAAGVLPEEIMLSEDPSFGGATWQLYRPVVTFLVSPLPGLKTVHAKVRSGPGNESGIANASITLTPQTLTLNAAKNVNDVVLSWNNAGAFEYSVYQSLIADFSTKMEFQTSPTAALTMMHGGAVGDPNLWFYKVETDPM